MDVWFIVVFCLLSVYYDNLVVTFYLCKDDSYRQNRFISQIFQIILIIILSIL